MSLVKRIAFIAGCVLLALLIIFFVAFALFLYRIHTLEQL